MSSQPPSKFYASLIYEDQVSEFNTHHRSQNWLLSYVDVFILIIMLVITLISLSNFKDQSGQQKVLQSSKQIVVESQQTRPEKNFPESPEKITAEKTEQIDDIPPTESQIPQEKTELTETTEKTEELTQVEKLDDKTIETEAIEETSLRDKFKNSLTELGLTDSVNMTISLGYAQLEIQDKILFKSSEAMLVNAGKDLLKKLSPLLKKSSGLIYIEGHTDSRPIKTSRFPSNWELGAARATSVLHYLASQQLNANRLRAVSYGDTKPIADNNTKEGREKNRRVNLIIKISDKID